MDRDPRPEAAELGLTDWEYERILHDVRQRQGIAEPPRQPSPQKPRSWLPRAMLGVIAVIVLIPILSALRGGDREPAYAFLKEQDGQPVTYSSCRLLQVAVYPAGGPPDAEELVREAVDVMRSATGLDIVVAGSFGGHAPRWNFQSGSVSLVDPIGISWQDGTSISALTDDTAGLGGSAVVGRQRIGGTIALSRQYYAQLAARGDHDEALAVLLHEFGHVFGLDHVDSPHELMYEKNNGRTTLGKGDLEGLQRVGHGPCV